jgi:putative protein-disulfide isomerase
MASVMYLFDPLCGWCYGASPALEKLAAAPGVSLALAPTGLFAGEAARPMDAQFAAYAWSNDQRIARLTGQAFSEDYRHKILGDHTRLFDSGPATLALTAVHLAAPRREFEALKAIQRARYVDGRDNTDVSILIDLLRGLGLVDAAERLAAPDQDLLAAYAGRLSGARADMRRFQITGVPALIVGDGDKRRAVSGNVLFADLNALLAELKAA